MSNIHGTCDQYIRGREQNYRGLNTEETPMLPVFVAYYNLVREHKAVGNKTPAQAACIDIKLGKDKWGELINKTHNNLDGKEDYWFTPKKVLAYV